MKLKTKITILFTILFILSSAIFSEAQCSDAAGMAKKYRDIAKDSTGDLNTGKVNAILNSKSAPEEIKAEFIKLLESEGKVTKTSAGTREFILESNKIPSPEIETGISSPATKPSIKTADDVEGAKAELFNTFFENPPTAETQSKFMLETTKSLKEKGFNDRQISEILKESNEQASSIKWFRENMNNHEVIEALNSDPVLGQMFIDQPHWKLALEGRTPTGSRDSNLIRTPWNAYSSGEYRSFKQLYTKLMQSDQPFGPGMFQDGCAVLGCKQRNFVGAMGADTKEKSAMITGKKLNDASFVFVDAPGKAGTPVDEFVFFKPKDLKQLEENAKNLVDEIGLDPNTLQIKKFGSSRNDFYDKLYFSDKYAGGGYYDVSFNKEKLTNELTKSISGRGAFDESAAIKEAMKKIDYNFAAGREPALVTYDSNPQKNLLKIQQWHINEMDRIGQITNAAEQIDAYNLHFAKFRQSYILTHPAGDYNGRMATAIINVERSKVGLPPAVYDTANDVFLTPEELAKQMSSTNLIREVKRTVQ